MKIKIFTILILLISVSSIFAQGKRRGKSTAGYYQYEAECEGSEMDGSQLVRAFGTGRTKADAKEQAKKAAVYAVIFKGIRLGKPGCSLKPLVFNPNIEEQKQDFFNEFFQDGGKFQDFVTFDDVPARMTVKEKGEGAEKVFGLVLTIKMVPLKKYLTEKGIIPVSVE
ncbi:MAG: hypothetical protein SFY32_13170 [Bacteroidota bacterium]|nr:hypothetical protein [Bacteroidota bacterium]